LKGVDFLKAAFREYYFKMSDRVEVPEHIEEREFGYQNFEGVMIRHLSFRDGGDLRAFLLREVPAGVYCSPARYTDPTLPMEEKGWKEADLIFDIDADELECNCWNEYRYWICESCSAIHEGAKLDECPTCGSGRLRPVNFVCNECIKRGLGEVSKLLEILKEDFGVKEGDVKVYFSGNVGFHIHVKDERFKGLGPAERAEICDYLMGRGLMPEVFGFGRGMPLASRWRDRVLGSSSLAELRRRYRKMGYEGFRSWLEQVALKAGAHIDPSVTIDVHRIFRLPGTLHRKSGMAKVGVRGPGFDPFRDAMPFGSEPVRLFVERSPRLDFRGEPFGPFEREEVELPKGLAVYLVAKGVARPL